MQLTYREILASFILSRIALLPGSKYPLILKLLSELAENNKHEASLPRDRGNGSSVGSKEIKSLRHSGSDKAPSGSQNDPFKGPLPMKIHDKWTNV